MSNTVDSVVAKRDISELIYLYERGLDRWDDALLRSLFTADAWCEYGFMNGSAKAFIDYALGALKDHTANQHMVGNILVELEGDEAFGEVYFNAYHKVKTDRLFGTLQCCKLGLNRAFIGSAATTILLALINPVDEPEKRRQY